MDKTFPSESSEETSYKEISIDDGKFALWTEDEVGELTIDCEDPLFKNNANCLTYSNPNGDTYKSKYG